MGDPAAGHLPQPSLGEPCQGPRAHPLSEDVVDNALTELLTPRYRRERTAFVITEGRHPAATRWLQRATRLLDGAGAARPEAVAERSPSPSRMGSDELVPALATYEELGDMTGQAEALPMAVRASVLPARDQRTGRFRP